MGNTREPHFCDRISGQSRLPVERTCNMLIHLLVIGFSLSSSAEGDQKFTELKRISEAGPAEDGEGRLIRLRTCRNESMLQCELCEIIRIVNVSHAVGQLFRGNGRDGCSAASFQREFDCFQPSSSQYLEEIIGRCKDNQICQLSHRREVFNCSTFVSTESCCEEIFYRCEPRKGVYLSSLFMANDSYGNAYISLRCPSSDLSVVSVVLAFNSSGEFHEGGVCYKLSTNKENVAKRCDKKGCSHVQVSGARGCGGNKYVNNYGAYIYYICRSSHVNQCQRTMTATTAPPPMTRTMIATTATIPMTQTSNRWIIVGVLLVVAILVILVVGIIVCTKRRRMAKIDKEPTGTAFPQKIMTYFRATRESRGGTTPQMERKECSYPGIASMAVQGYQLDNSEYCEINDLEREVMHRGTDSKRDRDDRTNRGTDEGEVRIETNAGLYAYTEPQKVQWQHTPDEMDNRGSNQNVIYAEVADSINDLEFIYAEIDPLQK